MGGGCTPRGLVAVASAMGWRAEPPIGYGGFVMVEPAGVLTVHISWKAAWVVAEMGPWTSRFEKRWLQRALVVNRDTLGVKFGASPDGRLLLTGQLPSEFHDRDVAELVERMARYVRHYADYLGIELHKA